MYYECAVQLARKTFLAHWPEVEPDFKSSPNAPEFSLAHLRKVEELERGHDRKASRLIAMVGMFLLMTGKVTVKQWCKAIREDVHAGHELHHRDPHRTEVYEEHHPEVHRPPVVHQLPR